MPDAAVVGPALAGPFLNPKVEPAAEEFLGKVLQSKAAHHWSAITLHPYRKNEDGPETMAPQLELVRQMMRDRGLDPDNAPVITGEWGYSTWQQGVDEKTQAAYAVRGLLLATAGHMPFSIWYDWQDDGPNAADREQRFGLLRAGSLKNNGEDLVKPSYAAVRQTSELLRGYRFSKIVENNPYYTVLAFNKGDNQAYVAWAGTAHFIRLALSEGHWTATRLLGDAKALNSTAGSEVILPVATMPTIIMPAE